MILREIRSTKYPHKSTETVEKARKVASITPIIFVLIASESTKSLKGGLNCFKQMFNIKYEKIASKPVVNQTEFTDLEILIEKCFPFVPRYIH